MRFRKALVGFAFALVTACSAFSGSDQDAAHVGAPDGGGGGDGAMVGIVDGGEGQVVDAATGADAADASRRKRVFLASGGATGATALKMCNSGASALQGQFAPWLGRADGTSPLAGIGQGPWFLVDPITKAADPNALVATSPSQLAASGVTIAIDRDETGSKVTTAYAFTGTLPDAAAIPTQTCTDWTDGNAGLLGGTGAVTPGMMWASSGVINCASSGTVTSVYCFED